MVRKNDGSRHFCVDYRKLNSVTHHDAYPLPRIDATLDSLAGYKYFTTLDLASGYWQVALEESDKGKAAFSALQEHYEFYVMPFGLTNAPATFQRFMEYALAGLTNEQCLIYLDNIIVYSSPFVGLQLKLSKCTFASTTVHYLGHVVSAIEMKPDPHKIEAVSQYPVPTNTKELKKFLGLANYYHKFIYNYVTIAEPLNKLLRGHKKQFLWTVSCQQAFDHLQSKLVTSPILGYPDFATPFVLYTNASHAAIGAVLSQFQHNNEVVISYWSCQLSKAERKCSTIEREALAVVGTVKEFYPYLYGLKFKLITDHNPLVSLKDLKDVGGRLVPMMLYFQQFDYSFEHRPGKNHANVDTTVCLDHQLLALYLLYFNSWLLIQPTVGCWLLVAGSPLPRIDATLDSLAGYKYFTTLDLASGYWEGRWKRVTKGKQPFQLYRGIMSLCNAIWPHQCPCHLSEAHEMCSGWIDE